MGLEQRTEGDSRKAVKKIGYIYGIIILAAVITIIISFIIGLPERLVWYEKSIKTYIQWFGLLLSVPFMSSLSLFFRGLTTSVNRMLLYGLMAIVGGIVFVVLQLI